jgi:hypothetical protein
MTAGNEAGDSSNRSRSRVGTVALLLAVPPALLAVPLAASHVAMLVRRLLPTDYAHNMKATLVTRGNGMTTLVVISCLLAVAAVLVGTTAMPRRGDRAAAPARAARAAVVLGCLALLSILWLTLTSIIPGMSAPR